MINHARSVIRVNSVNCKFCNPFYVYIYKNELTIYPNYVNYTKYTFYT
jgi:hypothetical protein